MKRKKVFTSIVLLSSALIINICIGSALANIPICDGFDYPLGPPDGRGYEGGGSGLEFLESYDYQGDSYPEYHP